MQKPSYIPKKYIYVARTGNLKAEAVGVVKRGEAFSGFRGGCCFQTAHKIETAVYAAFCLCGSFLVVGDWGVFYAGTAVSACVL